MWDNTPLLLACQYGHCHIAEYLISTGADVNAVNEKDCTPLLYATLEGMKSVVVMLLEKGATHKMEAGLYILYIVRTSLITQVCLIYTYVLFLKTFFGIMSCYCRDDFLYIPYLLINN